MLRCLASALILSLLLGLPRPAAGDASEKLFPRPPELEPAVVFWRRVFSEVDSDGGFIHDARDLSIVYEIVRHPEDRSGRARHRHEEDRKDHYRDLLHRLARGDREDLSDEEARVLALFPDGVSSRRLRKAATRIRFQRGLADRFLAGLRRMGRWEGYIRRVLSERGLPPDLVALPHVESSFNPAARSHVGASGIWQFTRSTGRLFMRVDNVVDERNDPFLASEAAARLLAQNYERLGAWPLAITAYNHGAAGMARAVRRLGTTDIAEVVDRYRSRTFGFASRNFYVEFLAARDIELAPERYFGAVTKDPPENPEILVLDHYVPAASLARAFGVTPDALREANPALRRPVWQGRKHVPKGYPLRVPRDPMRAAPRQVASAIPAAERFDRQTPDLTHRVRRGETLSRIAARYGVRQSEIAALNGLRSRHRIYVGQVLKLPVSGRAPASVAAAPAGGVYEVRRGDNLASIARRFGVSTREIARVNRLADPDRLRPGQALEIPGAGGGAPRVYTVRRGDNLATIAKRFGVSSIAIARANRLANPDRLRPGQSLRIPGAGGTRPSVYTVRRGDTLSRIARRFGVSQQAIAVLNGLADRHEIRVGQQLRLPTD